MKDFMIDLETFGVNTAAPIVSIGVAHFDINTGEIIDKFYKRVTLKSSVEASYESQIDPVTVLWWMRQSDKARAEVYNEEGAVTIADALKALQNFFGEHALSEHVRIWGNGAVFDNVILETAYRRVLGDDSVPWKFWNSLCFRTLKALFPVDDTVTKFKGTKHNALDDAIHQVEVMTKIINKLGGV